MRATSTRYPWLALLSTVVLLLAISACSTGRDRATLDKAEYHYKLASNYYFDANPAMALRELDTALTIDPRHERAHFLRAFVALGRRQHRVAVTHLKTALEIKPDYFDARENLGAAYLAMKRWHDAIDALTPLLDEHLYSTPFILHNNLGYAYRALHQTETAMQHFKQAIFLNPRFCLGMFNIGETYEQMGDIRAAVKSFKKAVDKCPNYTDAYYRLGVAYEKSGRVNEAVAFYRQCMKFGGETLTADRCRMRVEGDVL